MLLLFNESLPSTTRVCSSCTVVAERQDQAGEKADMALDRIALVILQTVKAGIAGSCDFEEML